MSNFPNYTDKLVINTLTEETRKDIKSAAYYLSFSILESQRRLDQSTQSDPLKKGIIEFGNNRLGEPLYEISLIPINNLEGNDSVSPLINNEESTNPIDDVIDILIADIQVSRSNELKIITPIDRNGYSSFINSVGGNIVNMSIRVPGGYRKEEKNWLFVSTLLRQQGDYIIFDFQSEFLKNILPQNRLLLTSITFSDNSESSNMIELQCQFVDVNENLKLF